MFDSGLLDSLSAAARSSLRLRQNHNLHANPTDPVQRFFNAIEPASYVTPHCHLAAGKEETLVILRGRLGLVFFDAAGAVTDTRVLSPAGSCCGFHMALGVWHSVVALTPGTIFFETKAGPYQPLTDAERAPWAPAEGTPEAVAYLAKLHELFG